MATGLIDLIVSTDDATRNLSLDEFCGPASFSALLAECETLEAFRHRSENLYERVRALFFLAAIHRFHLPVKAELPAGGQIPFQGYEHLLHRRFEEAIEIFTKAQKAHGPSDALSSALTSAYHRLAFQTLADQVRRSVRTVRGNQWMFRMGHPKDQPLRVRRELLTPTADGSYPILRELTPVRMDLTHSAWSDIFFLGMDYPEGAKVLNVSVDLGVHGRDTQTQPPVSAWLRVIEEPVLRLVSVDLNARADISNLAEVFDFAKDYLGLLKAAVIAAGIVPPGIEGSGQSLADLLAEMLGPGRGLELVSSVNDIPKGSRLAVSTNLLAALIGVCMRATGQAESLTGPLRESERRLVLARALSSNPVQLFSEVDELKVHRERAQHIRATRGIQALHEHMQRPSVVADRPVVAQVAAEQPNALFNLQQACSALLDDDLAKERAEQANVSAQRRCRVVRCGGSGRGERR